ncbi:MAG TPA: molybdopterin-dependent oxidoreductase [Terriglobales bacterium]|nr:molybdopterin-dependent oxidoreductase [Terriglobales bacterium]
MRRREFVLSTTAVLLASAGRLRADHHVLSADPLVVAFDLASLQDRYTPIEDFYVRNHFDSPAPPASPVLTIEGEVEHPQQLQLTDLDLLPRTKIGAVLECAGDPVTTASLVSNGIWQGWPLSQIISRAGPKPTGTYLHLFGRDGFSRSVPTDRAMEGGLLITALNGRPLTRNHGAPWRALFPGWYGMDSVKWIERIVLAPALLPPVGMTYLQIQKEAAGNLQSQPLPPIQIKSVITEPINGAVLRRGRVQVRGLAWSGCGTVSAVHLSTDRAASWQAATLEDGGSRYDWVRWSVALALNKAGVVELVARATDSAGNSQPFERQAQRVDRYAYNVCDRVRCIVT